MNDLTAANAAYIRGDTEKAAELYLSLARSGNLDAMFNMGYLYQFGLGVDADYEKAVDFYSVAIYLDGGDAAYNLAVMQMNGYGVKQDIAKGIKTMHTSAAGGCPEAQLYLACAYSMGYAGNPVYSNICRIPFHRAEKRYEFFALDSAFDEFDSENQEKIENERIRAISENDAEALYWLSLAASNEDDDDVYGETIQNAKYLLGLFRIEGIACQPDRKLGEKLIREAALAGHPEAQKYLLEARNDTEKG